MTSASSSNSLQRTNGKALRTRERILDAAAQVVATHGYGATKLSDVADIARVRVPAMYYHFASREELIEAVLVIGSTRVRESVRAAIKQHQGSDPLDRIDAAVAEHLRVTLSDSAYARASVRTMGELPNDIEARQADEHRQYGLLWRDLLAEAINSGDVNPHLDPTIARMMVIGALNWTVLWWESDRMNLDTLIANSKLLVRGALTGDSIPG